MGKLIIQDGRWTLLSAPEEKTKDYLFPTGGTFVDKDIHLNVAFKEGSLEVPSEGANIEPDVIQEESSIDFSYTKDFDITLDQEPGWVENVEAGNVLIHSSYALETGAGIANIPHEDGASRAGYDVLNVTTKSGYYGEETTGSVDVYQGLCFIGQKEE